MQFLSPIWFVALAALVIPVIIHLWNIRPGKTLKVGSISLITEASKSNSRSLKLLDILLLLLRCLLLALLALLLAMPVWQHIDQAAKAKGWLLIPKENFKESYQKFKPTIDSLSLAGYEFHYFNKGLTKADLKVILADSTLKDIPDDANYWSRIKQLDTQIPASLPVYVFTPNGANHFKGTKPGVGLNLHWQTYIAADSVSKWIAGASVTNTGAIKVTQGNSSPSGTYFKDQLLQTAGNAGTELNVKNGQPFVNLKNSGQEEVPVDTATLRIAIYTDKYGVDAGYLKAALLAATNFNGRKALIRQYSNAAQIPGGQSWLFWLSEQPVSNHVKSSKHIFSYESGRASNISSWINAGSGSGIANVQKNIALFKLITANDKNESLWQDGFGHKVLSVEKKQYGNSYRFYSRFNPLWNDLVWSDDFPKLVLKLISGDTYTPPEKFDKRVLTIEQLQPYSIKAATVTSAAPVTAQTDLSRYCWLLLVMVFIAERWLSHKNKLIQTNG